MNLNNFIFKKVQNRAKAKAVHNKLMSQKAPYKVNPENSRVSSTNLLNIEQS